MGTRQAASATRASSGNFRALVNIVNSAAADDTAERKRHLLADLCRLLGKQPASADRALSVPLRKLPPRTRQVLDQLLQGKSEKEVAKSLGLSVHTVHVHVKTLYKRLGVSSRGELLSRCLG